MVNVIGLGYIGLPTALMMAAHGETVAGTDRNADLVARLNAGQVTFREEGLEELFSQAQAAGITFSAAYQRADFYVISVPTPYEKVSRKMDAGAVLAAVRQVLCVCPKGAVIIIESTVSPGTIHRCIYPIAEAAGFTPGEDIFLVHAPERIIPGNMLAELGQNNRIIGADQPEVGQRVKRLYASFCRGDIAVTDIRTAEMTKVAENAFRAVNIAFANELATICHASGLDVYEIIRLCNMHPRVNILQPGPGVGGHCISVDPWFLVGDYPALAKVIGSAMEENNAMPDYVLGRIRAVMEENGLRSLHRVGLYGLTYKENVDDIRNAPTLQLLERQNCFPVYDPFVARDVVPCQHHDLMQFLGTVDMVVIMVKHRQIQENQHRLRGKVILDCCNAVQLPGVYHL